MNINRRMAWMMAAVLGGSLSWGSATSRTWIGGPGNDWFTGANWNPSGIPADGDSVWIGGGAVFLSNTTAALSAFSISNATLTFSNWPTTLRSSQVDILNNGTLTHAVCDTNAAIWNTNRVAISATDVTIHTGGKIDARSRGFRAKQGPGYNAATSQGASYGGNAGNRSGETYGSLTHPLDPGSGGWAGVGGGAVHIAATAGTVRVNGLIDTETIYAQEGPGSGGGILIECRVFDGTGQLRANGGTGKTGGNGSGGGGGRIAIHYDPIAQAAEAPNATSIVIMASGGYAATDGEPGTVYLPDMVLLRKPDFNLSGAPAFATGNVWSAESLVLAGRQVTLPDHFTLVVTQSLTISSSGSAVGTGIGRLTLRGVTNTLALNGTLTLNKGTLRTYDYAGLDLADVSMTTGAMLDVRDGTRLTIGGDLAINSATWRYEFAQTNPCSFTIDGDLTMTNGAAIHLYAGPTNNVSGRPYGGQLDLSGRDLVIHSNCWIYPYSDNTNGGSIEIRARNVSVMSSGGINAISKGFRGGMGPGAGTSPSRGGGYGGRGGKDGGMPYGSEFCPEHPGSGGAAGAAGGLIWIVAPGGLVQVDGTLDAGAVYAQEGAGSGGGILIVCRKFTGTGLLSANGGPATHGSGTKGPGGGGRIAVLRMQEFVYERVRSGLTNGTVYVETPPETFTGIVRADAGPGGEKEAPPGPGTIRFGTIIPRGSMLSVR